MRDKLIAIDEDVEEEGRIEQPQPDSVPKEPLKIPTLEFVEIDMHNDAEVCTTVLTRLTIRFKKCMNFFPAIMSKMTTPHFDLPIQLPSLNGIHLQL